MSLKYENKTCNKFVADMKKEGLEVKHYKGRYFWEGPAVSCNDLQDVMSATKVKVQWDQLGKGYIVYPVASSKLVAQTADHPVLARPDRVVTAIELESFKAELKMAGFENITAEPFDK